MSEKDEQPDKTVDTGKKPDNDTKADKPISIVDEARSIRDEIVKARDELKEENVRKEKLQSEALLSGSAGGHVEAKLVSPEDKKKAQAQEFFKDTALHPNHLF